MSKVKKRRTTVFINSHILRKAKARGMLENLTLSEIIEKRLREYGSSLEEKVKSLL